MSNQTTGMFHATGDQQAALVEIIEAGGFPAEIEVGGKLMTAHDFLNQMSACEDILPLGSTYGDAARVLMDRLPQRA